MNVNPVLLHSDDTVAVALHKMTTRAEERAVVVDRERRLLGVLSAHDLIAWAEGLAGEDSVTIDDLMRHAGEDLVGNLIPTTSLTIEDSAPLSATMRTFFEARPDAIVAVRDGRVSGIVAPHDVLRSLAAAIEPTAEPETTG
jgi:CBS domain-containing protein